MLYKTGKAEKQSLHLETVHEITCTSQSYFWNLSFYIAQYCPMLWQLILLALPYIRISYWIVYTWPYVELLIKKVTDQRLIT